MKTSDFFFELPQHLIAQYPGGPRGHSRLMTLDRATGNRAHKKVVDLPEILDSARFTSASGAKPLLVFNDTKVRKARIEGRHEKTGAVSEFLLLEKKDEAGAVWKALVKRAKRKKIKSVYVFLDSENKEAARAKISANEGEYVILEFDRAVNEDWLEKNGHIPLPPYIKRKDAPSDANRYQTIYARETGSAAAPTAGLHFTDEILRGFASRGIESAFVTLHVGLGTFLPVRSENVEDHLMHKESFIITEENACKIESAKAQGRKIIAVGTTSLRALESSSYGDGIKRGRQDTSIFIYPGYKFKKVDALFTNFHTPLSTLLMLVCAFADGAFSGRQLIFESYAEAIREEYRFFSYGDAMLIY